MGERGRPRGGGSGPAPVATLAAEWNRRGMARTRVSTTVDDELLTRAREVTGARSDAALLDSALGALLDNHRRAEIDRADAAYDEHPVDEADEWGDLASFRAAAAHLMTDQPWRGEFW